MITELKENEIFIFGSNLAGKHLGGAARQAKEEFGAEEGVGEGITGNCYAFPTLDNNFRKRELIEMIKSSNRLFDTIANNPDKTFLLTKVGCGIAGYDEETMKTLFEIKCFDNLIKPEEWK